MSDQFKPFDNKTLTERLDVGFALKAARLGVWELDPITNLVNWDDQCRDLFGLKANQLPYEAAIRHIHPDDVVRVDNAVRWAMNPESGGNYDVTYRTIGANDGLLRWVRFMGQGYFNQAGEVDRFAGVAQDVTRDVQTQQHETRSRILIEEAPVATCLFVGRELVIEVANQQMLDIWGKGTGAIGMPLAQALPELEGQSFLKILDEVYTTGQPYYATQDKCDLVIDGQLKTYYFNFIYKPLLDQQGQVYAILDMAIDVTETVKARQQIAETEESLRGAIELAELATWSIDHAENTITYSDRMKDWIGNTEGELGFNEIMNYIPQSDRERIQTAFVRAMQSESGGLYNEEFPLENGHTGQRRIIHAQAKTYFDEQRNPSRLVGTAQDITKHRQQQLDLEQLLQERTRERWHLSAWQNAILEHAGQAIISTDTEGMVVTANPAAEKLLGYQPGELIGQVAQVDPGTLLVPFILSYQPQRTASTASGLFEIALEKAGYFHTECILLGKQQQRIPVLMASSVLLDEAGKVTGFVGMALDISALKAAEESLQQKNRELNTFFEGALDLHCICDSNGKLLKINRAFQTALGYSETELLAIPFLQLVHTEEQSFVLQHLLSDILHQPVRNQINRFRKKDGSYRIIEWNAIGIDELVYGSARDITERQEAETQLQRLNERLQLATRAAGQGIWEDDLETGILIWDDRLWEMHGIAPGRTNWSFQEYTKLIHPQDLAAFLVGTNQGTHLSSEEDRFSNVCRIIKPDGTIAFIEQAGLVVRNPQGRPIRVIGVAWDVTEQKRAEAALRESEERFRQIAENVDEVFWIHAVEPFELLYINPAYERMFGVEPSRQPLGEISFWETILPEDLERVKAEFEKYRQGQEVTVQCRVQGNHRTTRWVQIRTFVMRDSHEIPLRYIGIVNDITGQKEKELVLQQSLLREQELNKLKSQFVSTASHEFRTPLTTIQTSVYLIKLYLEKPQDTARPFIEKHLGLINQQIQNFDGLLTDMLTIGRIEAGKVVFNPQQVDVEGLCQLVITNHFSHQADGRTVRVSRQGNPYTACLDEKLMGHVLVNLLSNAFKFSKEDPGLMIQFAPRELVIRVIDVGIGIPANDLPALFQTFFRARNTSTIQGTGLGLAIARQFVELHGGRLTVQSEEAKGTTFTIVLPVMEAVSTDNFESTVDEIDMKNDE
jgi:PAS domain S-box-containing protein